MLIIKRLFTTEIKKYPFDIMKIKPKNLYYLMQYPEIRRTISDETILNYKRKYSIDLQSYFGNTANIQDYFNDDNNTDLRYLIYSKFPKEYKKYIRNDLNENFANDIKIANEELKKALKNNTTADRIIYNNKLMEYDAIKKNPENIKIIDYPSLRTQQFIINKDLSLVKHIHNINYDTIIMLLIRLNEMYAMFDTISRDTSDSEFYGDLLLKPSDVLDGRKYFIDKDYQMILYHLYPYIIEIIENPSPELIMATLENFPFMYPHINIDRSAALILKMNF